MQAYLRYVALGDSQTEGAGDYDDEGRPIGWADRFAHALQATTSPDLLYANLAVGGCRARHVREVQLPAALELRPDLATVAVGMNDVLRHDFDLDSVVADVEHTVATLREAGATVATMTFPDVGMMLPVMRWLRPREERLNDAVREIAGRYDVPVLELFEQRMCADARMWSHDRIHGSTEGHRRIAEGMAGLFGLPDADPAWADPLPDRPWTSPFDVVRRDVWWALTFAVPFLTRQLRGRRPQPAKRPTLRPAAPASESAESAERSSA